MIVSRLSTRRSLALGLAVLLGAACTLVVWGPAPLAHGIGTGWDAVCSALGWEEKAPPPQNGVAPADRAATTNPMKVAPGDPAPAFVLRDSNGVEFRLRDWQGRRPVVLEFGSYT